MRTLRFSKNFYWGTATSAYQVEGGIKNDCSEAGKKYDAGIACDHYNRYEEDFDLAEEMNNNAHRFSIEWARIEPEEGKFDQKEIEHYRKVIGALKSRGLEPFVTLYHYTLPLWFAEKGSWLNKNSLFYFSRYAEKLAQEYGNSVKFWITINEPHIYVNRSFLAGRWPPFTKNIFKAIKVFNKLIKAHQKAYQAIHRISPDAQIGIAKNNIFFPKTLFLGNYFINFYFLNRIKNYQDFIGLNYYHGYSLKGQLKDSERDISDLGWGIYPEGIYHVLKDLKKYNRPIYITENGIADAKDKKRPKFIVDHLRWVHKAIEEGIDVRGYFYWSLIDNFEWDKRFWPRFGLIEIDYDDNLKRIPRPSSKVYAKICKNNAIEI